MGKPHRLAVTADAPFMAIAFGAWEGMILDEVAWRAAPPTIRRRGFRDRGRAGPRLAAAHAGQTVAVVTHVLPALGPGPARLWAGHNALWHLEGLREP